MLRYLTLIMSSVILILFLIFNIIKSKEINSLKNFIGNENSESILPFVYLIKQNIKLFSKLLNNKVSISLKNLYGEEILQKKQIIFLAKKLFLFYYLTILFLVLFSILNKNVLLIGWISFIIGVSILMDSNILKLYQRENQKFKTDLPSFITRLSLLTNVGLGLRVSIDFILENTTGEVVEKFNNVKKLINNGMSEIEAYNTILIKTDDILIRKFISNIIQNIKTGGDDLEESLELMRKESSEFKKSQIILKAQEANRKLLIPNLLIFAGIMVMVMLPVLLNVF